MITPKEWREIRKRLQRNFNDRRDSKWLTGYNVALANTKNMLQDYLTPAARREKLRIDYECGR